MLLLLLLLVPPLLAQSCCCEIEDCETCTGTEGCSWCSRNNTIDSYCTRSLMDDECLGNPRTCASRDLTTAPAATTLDPNTESILKAQYCSFRTACEYCNNEEGRNHSCGYCLTNFNGTFCTIAEYCHDEFTFHPNLSDCPLFASMVADTTLRPLPPPAKESIATITLAWVIAGVISCGLVILVLGGVCAVAFNRRQRHAPPH